MFPFKLAFLFVVLVFTPYLCKEAYGDSPPPPLCARIVSLSPSITETLFELGLGNQIVGGTRFDRYPEEAKAIAPVGGLFDINLEEIIHRRATVVFLLAEHRKVRELLQRLDIPIYQFDHRRVDGIRDSIGEIGRLCERVPRATALLASIDERVTLVRSRSATKNLKRVLIVVGSTDGSLYVSGRDGFYTDLLQLLGFENIYQGFTASVASLSLEELLVKQPELIFSVEASGGGSVRLPPVLQYANIPFVQLVGDFFVIPGPRYPLALERMANAASSVLNRKESEH